MIPYETLVKGLHHWKAKTAPPLGPPVDTVEAEPPSGPVAARHDVTSKTPREREAVVYAFGDAALPGAEAVDVSTSELDVADIVEEGPVP